jgi:hypothetical protein
MLTAPSGKHRVTDRSAGQRRPTFTPRLARFAEHIEPRIAGQSAPPLIDGLFGGSEIWSRSSDDDGKTMAKTRAAVGRLGRGWAWAAVWAGLVASGVSRRLGVGAGSIIGGRVTLLLDPGALSGLAVGRRIVLVSGTNGKTTTSHLLAAALRTSGRVAHNATGSNMADGAVAALAAARDAEYAVLEVDEWHLAAVATATGPAVVVLLNLTRDQLDRGTEVRAVAAAVGAALTRLSGTVVVANADDPMVVWAAANAARVCWVAPGAGWLGDVIGRVVWRRCRPRRCRCGCRFRRW